MRLSLRHASAALTTVGPVAVLVLIPAAGLSQSPGAPSVLGQQADIACAPRLSTSLPNTTVTIVGSQDGTAKLYYGPSDTLVIGAGQTQGIEAGQEYFVRRVVSLGRLGNDAPLILHTAGWIRITAVERDSALGSVVRACDSLQRGDFLEPVEWPDTVPLAAPGDPDYDNAGAILFGLDGRQFVAENQYFVLTLGRTHGVVPGQRLTVFRKTVGHLRAVTELGEAVAVAVEDESATARLIRMRAVIEVGDLIAPHR